ncbi:MAG: sensor histidine kinase, partial [Myxococcales bacterium]|nr:sensor histidine kinase [Myxococcales bacterium]
RLEGEAERDPNGAPVPLRALVERCWAPHAEAAAQRRLQFRIEIDDDATIAHDGAKLELIISNLLANAVQYTETGGWIHVGAQPESGVLLSVADSGPQLAEEDLARMFERFWRGDDARSEAGAHCGIGLALVRSLAEHLGCTIHAENRSDGSLAFVLASHGRKRPSFHTLPR